MPTIKGIEIHEESTQRSGGSGDNWHMTWADDDNQYVGLCDGQGWSEVDGYTSQNYNTRVYGLEGQPPDHRFAHLPGFPNLLTIEPPNASRYYGFGIIAVDGVIYHYLSTPNTPFNKPLPRFFGAKLIYSDDHGQTWRNQDGGPLVWEWWDKRSSDNMVFFEEPGDAFSLLTALQMGKNYEHNSDGFVYIYAPNGNTEGSMNQLVMFRVRKESVLDRSSYEFFAGHNPDRSAKWSKDILDRGVVHTFPKGWVNTQVHPYAWHPSVVYNAPLGLYMMVNWGMGCSDDGEWFGKPSYLGFWTAEHPWGPWFQVHEETEWTPFDDPDARAYQPQISPKWIADDGKSFWLIFTDFQVLGGSRPYYCFNYQRAEILV
ncbi:MAG: hypothetical protein QGH20_11155 [Candidatus Latescibacteria bacterium]|nr:hypothetical protein [Candidatus Latescibacterota bacterium]